MRGGGVTRRFLGSCNALLTRAAPPSVVCNHWVSSVSSYVMSTGETGARVHWSAVNQVAESADTRSRVVCLVGSQSFCASELADADQNGIRSDAPLFCGLSDATRLRFFLFEGVAAIAMAGA